MDEAGYQAYMRRQRKSARTIERYTIGLRTVADFLRNRNPPQRLDDITPKEMQAFESWGAKKHKKVNQCIWALKVYAEYTANGDMEMLANERLGSRYAASYMLKDFLGVDPNHAKMLGMKGIRTVQQMLDAGRTKNGRKRLCAETGVPLDALVELVKLCDLARIPGLRKVRARLYLDAGLDTVEEIARRDSGELIRVLTEFIERTGFNGEAPLPKEARTSVATARHIAKIVEY